MQISSDGKDVLASGAVIAFQHTITFQLADGPPPFRVTILFENTTKEGEAKTAVIEALTEGATYLILKLVNFDSAIGVGTAEPLAVGQLGGRRLYLHLRAYKLERTSHHLIYTWFLGENVGAQANG